MSGKAVLGIELGSTRIKSVLIDEGNKPLAQGSFEWENQFENGLWTYSIDMIWKGLQGSYSDLRANVRTKYGVEIVEAFENSNEIKVAYEFGPKRDGDLPEFWANAEWKNVQQPHEIRGTGLVSGPSLYLYSDL